MAKLTTDPEELKKVLELSEKIAENEKKALDIAQKRRHLLKDVHLLSEKGEKAYSSAIASAERQMTIVGANVPQLQKQVELYTELRDMVRQKAAANKLATKEELANLKKLSEETRRYRRLTEALGAAQEKTPKRVAASAKKSSTSVKDFAHSMVIFSDITAQAVHKGFTGAFKKVDESFRDLVQTHGNYSQTMHANFLYAQAPLAAMAKGIEVPAGMLTNLGVAAEETKGAMTALITEASYFRLAIHDGSVETQKAALGTINLIAHLKKLGLQEVTSAKLTDKFTRALKQTPEMANKSTRRLVAMADSLKIDLNTAITDFNNLAPQLTAWGDGMIDVFADLEVQAQATGLSMSDLNQAAFKMDTFEGAAEVAGKMNAILGDTYISVMDLVHADPAEKFDILRQAVADAGVEFSSLDRRYQGVFSRAMKHKDIEFTARLMGSEEDFDLIQKQLDTTAQTPEKLAARIEESMKIPDKMKRSLGELAPAMQELIDPARGVADALGMLPLNMFNQLATSLGSSKAAMITMTATGEVFAKKFDAVFSKTLLSLGLLVTDKGVQRKVKAFYKDMFPGGLKVDIPGLGKVNLDKMITKVAKIGLAGVKTVEKLFNIILKELDLVGTKYKRVTDFTPLRGTPGARPAGTPAQPTPLLLAGGAGTDLTPAATARFTRAGQILGESFKLSMSKELADLPIPEGTPVNLILDETVLASFTFDRIAAEREAWELKMRTLLGG